jgi:hypothetical protein
MTLKYARDIAMKDVEIHWEEPYSATWKSGLMVDQVKDLLLSDMRIDAAPGSDQPVLFLNDAEGVTLRQSRVGSVHITGSKSQGVRLVETESKVTTEPGVPPEVVK